ncbi:MAG: hypothetical protein ACRD4D_06400 [Candidatus Acidiferrales bacterium]
MDASLQNYSRLAPPPGLEQRIQAGLVTAVRRAPHLAWSGWLLPAGAAFAALLFFALRPSTPPAAPPAQIAETAPAAPPAPAPVARAVSAPVTRARPAAVAQPLQASALPRRERFPAPAPLSEQELLLLRYLEAASAQAAPPSEPTDRFAALTLEPMQFPPITIEKLERNP